ncbi:Pr6Pr family membrane protein [Homoserinimonas sp. OAct 916]|uniref:Pr6Pr family membrane protein n=1 Tax=Homoserinimonas sp. OAct 916 TaxID=2211450 RepID=UPI000DBE823A|nr:Pr6Pr family membrane protein [Homoserinimonas sp. OAct 916]
MTTLRALIRLIFAAIGITAVVATFFDTATRATINPFNFFGFFTMQSNLIMIAALLVTAVAATFGRERGAGVSLLRGCATTYIVIVGIVYNTLLVGLEGGVSLGWANTILHVVLPIYAAIDWLAFGDRARLAWRLVWVPLVYPIVWVVVVLIRGATDGWVPYPFLDPAQGYGVVALYAVAIAVATMAVASLVWAVSRLRTLGYGAEIVTAS